MNKKINALVIGKSGDGKSEFILSLLKQGDRKRIPSSGGGQTTRTSMTYHIGREDTPLRITATVLKKEEFVAQRMEQLIIAFESLVKEDDFSMEAFPEFREDIEELLIYDEAFFSAEEFPEKVEAIKALFQSFFPTNFLDGWKKEETEEETTGFLSSEVKAIFDSKFSKECNPDVAEMASEESISFQEMLEVFFEKIYSLCLGELKLYLQSHPSVKAQRFEGSQRLENLEELETEELSKFLKTNKKIQVSFSSLMKHINFVSSVNENYQKIFDKQRLSELVLVDTYGLDHKNQITSDLLKARYEGLFEAYPEIDSVFYIRSVASEPSPSDLIANIPAIFRVKPSVNSYVIFTKVDKLENQRIEDCKAFQSLDSKTFLNALTRGMRRDASEILLKNRLKTFCDSRMGYASVDPEGHFLEKNTEGLSKLFYNILFQTNLGSDYLSINKMSSENLKNQILMGKDIFVSGRDCTNFYSRSTRTNVALKNALKQGNYEWYSKTNGSYSWTRLVGGCCNARFSKMTVAYDWVDFLKTDSVALHEIFTRFPEKLKLSLFEILCGQKQFEIDSLPLTSPYNPPLYLQLRDLYAFSGLAMTGCFDQKIKEIYDLEFLPMLREHNARIFAQKEVHDHVPASAIVAKLALYFSEYDSNLSEEEKQDFECLMNSYRTVSLS